MPTVFWGVVFAQRFWGLLGKSAWALAVVCAVYTVGCVEAFGDKSPYEPGEALGTFHLTAKQKENTCGEGALGAPPVWEFDVKLSWGDSHLYWDSGGEVIVGDLSADKESFQISTTVIQDMRSQTDTGKPPCSLERDDTAKGTLTREGEGVSLMKGSLTYAFSPTEGSQCADLVEGDAVLFAALPCKIVYSFSAEPVGE
ncbi:MAG: hypothetical protein IPK82_40925 [Polyangiaceae bacterium]|nr:hypothetical protein [Polyangiaceae bacterium]